MYLQKIFRLINTKKNYLSGSILVFSLTFANFLNFLFNAYLGRTLDYETFGLVSVINSFMYLTTIPFAALNVTMNNRVGFLEERYNTTIAYSFWSNLNNSLLKISVGISIIWLLSAPLLMTYFNIQNLFPIILFTPVWLVGFLVAANKGFLKGKLMFVPMAVLTVLDPLVKLLSAFSFVHLNLSEWVYIAIPLSIITGYLLSTYYMARIKPEKISEINIQQIQKFPYKFFLVALLYGISSMIFLSLDIIIAKHFLSVEHAGQYALVSLTGKMVFFISTLFTIFITPFVSRNEGAKKDSSYILVKSLIVSSVLAFLGFLIVGVFGSVTVPFFFGEKAQLIVSHLLPFTFAVGCFSVSTVFISYYLTKGFYAFSVVTFFLAIAQIVAINIFHQDIAAIVQVMLFIGFANLVLVILLHLAINFVTRFENKAKNFLGIYTRGTPLQNPENNV